MEDERRGGESRETLEFGTGSHLLSQGWRPGSAEGAKELYLDKLNLRWLSDIQVERLRRQWDR